MQQELINWLKEKQGSRTLEEFGHFLGISHSTLSRIYGGSRGIGRHTLEKILAKYPEAISFFVSKSSNQN